VKTNYPFDEIIEVDKEHGRNILTGYEIDLSGGAELKFDVKGNPQGGNKEPSTKELPQAAKDFMNTHFAGLTYTIVRDENEFDVYTDVYEIEFNRQGNWTKVAGRAKTTLPESFLALNPVNNMNHYVRTNYPGRYIVEVEKDFDNGKLYYDVDLNNGIDLIFNAEGQFIKRD
jgi:hypothetical protein